MGKLIDLTGQKFGRLTVLSKVEGNPSRLKWSCQCDCGALRDVLSQNLRSGHTVSCGCHATEAWKRNQFQNKHGLGKTRIYAIWNGMKFRCYNEKCKFYKDYGGRGIFICDEWLADVRTFASWAYANGYSEELTIERIDVNGGYEPSNCTWIPMDQQPRNQRKRKKSPS